MEEAALWEFRAAIFAANQGNKKRLLEMLRADHPITAEDKAALADHLEGKHKPGRGRPPAPLHSLSGQLQWAVREIKGLQKRHKLLTQKGAIDLVCQLAKLQGKNLDKRRDEIIQSLNRGTNRTK